MSNRTKLIRRSTMNCVATMSKSSFRIESSRKSRCDVSWRSNTPRRRRSSWVWSSHQPQCVCLRLVSFRRRVWSNIVWWAFLRLSAHRPRTLQAQQHRIFVIWCWLTSARSINRRCLYIQHWNELPGWVLLITVQCFLILIAVCAVFLSLGLVNKVGRRESFVLFIWQFREYVATIA